MFIVRGGERRRGGGKKIVFGWEMQMAAHSVYLHGIYWQTPRRSRRHVIRQRAEIAVKPDKKEKRRIVQKNKISRANCLLCSVPAVLTAPRPHSLASL